MTSAGQQLSAAVFKLRSLVDHKVNDRVELLAFQQSAQEFEIFSVALNIMQPTLI
jgi:hypothetical protein